MMPENQKICAILPAYNCAEHLEAGVASLRSALGAMGLDYEIIIAEDGSTDGSHEAARKLEGGGVRLLHSAERLGKGRALSRAIRSTDAGIVLFMDADLSASPSCIAPLVRAVEGGADISIGSRLAPRASIRNRQEPRGFLSRAYNASMRALFSTGIRDHQCGFKAFRRRAVLSVLPLVRDGGWFWDTEVIVRAGRAGLRVEEVPIEWAERRESRLNLFPDVPMMALSALALRMELWGLRGR